MDPNEALRQLRDALRRLRYADSHTDEQNTVDYEVVAEYAQALDEWLSKGGFLPERWARNRT